MTAEPMDGLYESGESAPEAEVESETEPTEKPEAESVDEEESGGTTAVLDNKVLSGPNGSTPKEGDEITLIVVKNYGEESEVKYATKPKAAAAGEEDTDQEIDALNQG
jgi:hypothetical protein